MRVAKRALRKLTDSGAAMGHDSSGRHGQPLTARRGGSIGAPKLSSLLAFATCLVLGSWAPPAAALQAPITVNHPKVATAALPCMSLWAHASDSSPHTPAAHQPPSAAQACPGGHALRGRPRVPV